MRAYQIFRSVRRLLNDRIIFSDKPVRRALVELRRDEPFRLAALDTPGRQLAALVSAALSNHDSGKMHGTRAILAVAPDARDALHVRTLAATCRNQVLWACYLRSRAADENPKISFTACMRMLLIMLNAMVRHQTTCNPEFGGVPLNLPYPFPVAVGGGGGGGGGGGAVTGFAFKL
jgi:hypothetical protein